MRRVTTFATMGLLLFASCSDPADLIEPTPVEPDIPVVPGNTVTKEEILAHVQKVFNGTFYENHDWNSTVNGEVFVTANASIKKVQVMVCVSEMGLDNEPVTSMRVMNEATLNGQTTTTLSYDAPSDNLGIYVAFISDNTFVMEKVENGTANIANVEKTGELPSGLTLPTGDFTIGGSLDSYASLRGWMPGEKLYELSDYSAQKMTPTPYSETFTAAFRAIIFSYFKNGSSYSNLHKVMNSGYINEKAYPLTTGDGPIIVSPVYKGDKAAASGNEVWNSDLYYYYFSDEDIKGMSGSELMSFLQDLPKYKALAFKDYFGETEDDVIRKDGSYALLYFGKGIPEVGTKGSYTFPEGTKIGFMVRSKTIVGYDGKQGELYGDGRLNNYINFYGDFANSKLGNAAPRVAWLSLNGRKLMCWESGTDADFNDIILEVEGGIDIPIIPMEFEKNFYTYCYESEELGDYDMNDIVIRAFRQHETEVVYIIAACGATGELCVRNINSGDITDNAEVHALFGKSIDTVINTQPGGEYDGPVTGTKTVDKNFSFLRPETMPYIYNRATGKNIYLSKAGEDPHGILIPYDFKYPLENVCIKDAYPEFNDWGKILLSPQTGMVHLFLGKSHLFDLC